MRSALNQIRETPGSAQRLRLLENGSKQVPAARIVVGAVF
jgi:hypothetical protein